MPALYELRVYDIAVGGMPKFLQAIGEHGLPVAAEHVDVLGVWRSETGKLNQTFTLYRFDDLAARARGRTALQSDPRWVRDVGPQIVPVMLAQTSTLLRAIDGDPQQIENAGPTPRPFLFRTSTAGNSPRQGAWTGIPLGSPNARWIIEPFADLASLESRYQEAGAEYQSILYPAPFSRWR